MITEDMIGVNFRCQSAEDAEEALCFLEQNNIFWGSGNAARAGSSDSVYLQDSRDREEYSFCINIKKCLGFNKPHLYYESIDSYMAEHGEIPMTWTEYKAAYINDNLVTVSLSEYIM